ncbi:MAG: 50S ribosomal protein L10 [Proteobacteria bacterium]|jgi:large subunit ribosomal protein L10|nr:50S ribosomal protein L10 [Pseudomonadota bacterium]
MMTRTEKDAVVASLKEKITKSNAVFLTNLVGIPSNDAVRIRKNVRDVKGFMAVTKNTLFQRAAQGTYAEALLKDLKGSNAVAFSYDDAAAVAKVVNDAAGEFEEIVKVKGGMLGSQLLTAKEVVALAKLPSRDQMLGTLLATFNAPVSAFARVLHAICEQKEKQV